LFNPARLKVAMPVAKPNLAAPVLFLTIFAQKQVIESFSYSGVKG
jgi:hypothetical protein